MNVVDSCGWLEYLLDGPNARFFAAAIEDTEHLIVPSVCLLQVFKAAARARDEAAALWAVSGMHKGRVAELSASIAVTAARLGLKHGIPLADSVVLATARAHGAVLWTQDEHFRGIEKVRYRAAKHG